jgi:4,5-dihydroxyphthalate decarboxylase
LGKECFLTVRIELYGGDYEHTLELAGQSGGFDIRYNTAPVVEIFEKMLTERAFEACEFSLSNYIMLKDRGASWLHAVAVFPYRAFRHSTLYVRKDSAIRAPKDLVGRRIGVPDYSMTAAVWTRGILGEQYGVKWSDMDWVVSGRQRFDALPGLEMTKVDSDLETDLIKGRIDALLTPSLQEDTKPAGERMLRPVIADAQAAEEEYVRDYGVYPINHVIVIRDDILTANPGLPVALFDRYTAAKAAAYQRKLGTTMVPWAARHWKKVFDRFGGDPLPYGLTDLNRSVVQKLAGFLYNQKLIAAQPDIDTLFVEGGRG